MNIVAWDTETALIRPALLAPPLVCVTWQSPGRPAQIAHVATAEPLLRGWLESDCILVGHNVAYDLAVVGERFPSLRPLIFQAYAADRVTDTMLRQQLLDIAGGVYRGRFVSHEKYVPHDYTLETTTRRNTEMRLVKDAWRLSYGEFLDTPLSDWPTKAVEVAARLGIEGDPMRCAEYPLDDARATLAIYLAQEKHAAYLADQFRQARAAWALHLSSAWGLRTDEVGVETLRRETQAEYDDVEQELKQLGLVRENGTRDTKAAVSRMLHVCEEEKLTVRRTASHTKECEEEAGIFVATCHVCLDSDACNATGDDILEMYARASTLKKVLSNDVEALSKGIRYPVHTRYGIAESGRTTSSKPNVQNLRRKAGIREAFAPRPGKVFAAADYPQLELYTLAQCCATWLGQSKLAEALNAGLDPHLAMAAQIVGCSYEEAASRISDEDIDNARQTAKVANFGFPGGLGIAKLCLFAKKTYGVDLTEAAAKRLKAQWYAQWPEMPHYFARINALCDNDSGKASVETLFTKRYRGGASYCAACNNGFQALGADCAKEALWRVCREQYDVPSSALYNTRTVAFVHDEIIIEAPGASAHEAAMRLADVMVEGANTYLPDVRIRRAKVKPLLMSRWSKKAKPVFANGRLVSWA